MHCFNSNRACRTAPFSTLDVVAGRPGRAPSFVLFLYGGGGSGSSDGPFWGMGAGAGEQGSGAPSSAGAAADSEPWLQAAATVNQTYYPHAMVRVLRVLPPQAGCVPAPEQLAGAMAAPHPEDLAHAAMRAQALKGGPVSRHESFALHAATGAGPATNEDLGRAQGETCAAGGLEDGGEGVEDGGEGVEDGGEGGEDGGEGGEGRGEGVEDVVDVVDVVGSWPTVMRLPAGSAVLVRPDGHIAWRYVAGPPTGTEPLVAAAAAATRTPVEQAASGAPVQGTSTRAAGVADGVSGVRGWEGAVPRAGGGAAAAARLLQEALRMVLCS